MTESHFQNRTIGYACVSAYGQTLDVQLKQLKTAGCAKVYREKATGAQVERQELQRMLKAMAPGDVTTQLGTVTSSFTKGMISSIVPTAGVAVEHLGGFQLDLTATNGNSGGPVFSLPSGQLLRVPQGGAVNPATGHPVQGITKAEPIYPVFERDLIDRLAKGLLMPK